MTIWQAILQALGLGKPSPKPVPVPPPAPSPARPMPPKASDVIALMNRQRAAIGLPPLAEDPMLDAHAADWAGKMAGGLGLSHGDFPGRSAAMFPAGNYSDAEDIAEGQPDAASVVAAWMGSARHRANILGDFTHVGVGSSPDPQGNLYWSAIWDKDLG